MFLKITKSAIFFTFIGSILIFFFFTSNLDFLITGGNKLFFSKTSWYLLFEVSFSGFGLDLPLFLIFSFNLLPDLGLYKFREFKLNFEVMDDMLCLSDLKGKMASWLIGTDADFKSWLKHWKTFPILWLCRFSKDYLKMTFSHVLNNLSKARTYIFIFE